MRTADVATVLVLMAGGILVLSDSLRIGIGWSTDGPRSGFFPFWLAVVLLASCAVVAIKVVRRADRRPFVTRESIGPVLMVLAPAVGFVTATAFAGLYVAAALYLAVYMRWIGRHSWPAVLVVSIAFPVVTFFVFEVWFLVPMPKGPLETWLGY
jgi:hypothetical protein